MKNTHAMPYNKEHSAGEIVIISQHYMKYFKLTLIL